MKKKYTQKNSGISVTQARKEPRDLFGEVNYHTQSIFKGLFARIALFFLHSHNKFQSTLVDTISVLQ